MDRLSVHNNLFWFFVIFMGAVVCVSIVGFCIYVFVEWIREKRDKKLAIEQEKLKLIRDQNLAIQIENLRLLPKEELIKLSINGDTVACGLIEDEAALNEIRSKTNSDVIRQISCGKLGHKWEQMNVEEYQCKERGGGQHLDPCYGTSCSSCPLGGYNRTFSCTICGMSTIQEERNP